MVPESLTQGLSLTLLVSVVSLVAVWIPFSRAARIGLQAMSATRRLDSSQVERMLYNGPGSGRPSVTVQMLQVLRSAVREGSEAGHPTAFLIDASRQCVENDCDARYSRPIGMFANVLPPLGFIGTTAGLLILFLSMRVESESLELGALALALTSSIFALIGYAVLEALRIRLYGRTLARLDDAVAFHRKHAGAPRAEAGATAPGRPARATAG